MIFCKLLINHFQKALMALKKPLRIEKILSSNGFKTLSFLDCIINLSDLYCTFVKF